MVKIVLLQMSRDILLPSPPSGLHETQDGRSVDRGQEGAPVSVKSQKPTVFQRGSVSVSTTVSRGLYGPLMTGFFLFTTF